MHTYIHAHIHTCIHPCIHTHIHAYIHTYIYKDPVSIPIPHPPSRRRWSARSDGLRCPTPQPRPRRSPRRPAGRSARPSGCRPSRTGDGTGKRETPALRWRRKKGKNPLEKWGKRMKSARKLGFKMI